MATTFTRRHRTRSFGTKKNAKKTFVNYDESSACVFVPFAQIYTFWQKYSPAATPPIECSIWIRDAKRIWFAWMEYSATDNVFYWKFIAFRQQQRNGSLHVPTSHMGKWKLCSMYSTLRIVFNLQRISFEWRKENWIPIEILCVCSSVSHTKRPDAIRFIVLRNAIVVETKRTAPHRRFNRKRSVEIGIEHWSSAGANIRFSVALLRIASLASVRSLKAFVLFII